MTRNLQHPICLLLVACSGGYAIGCDGKETAESGHVAGTVQNSEFATQYAASYCQGIAGCCASNAIAFQLASCESSLSAQINAALAGRMADARVAYDADAAARCINSFHDATVACTNRELYRAADEP
ncbi:MAG TPA: hypothetical protein VIV60_11435, partial [Polyangiaceae bacterium]